MGKTKGNNTAARKPEKQVDPHPGKHWVLWVENNKARMRLVKK